MTTVTLYPGNVLSVRADDVSSGRVYRMPMPGAAPINESTGIAVGETRVFGPFRDVRNYDVVSERGRITYFQAPAEQDVSAQQVQEIRASVWADSRGRHNWNTGNTNVPAPLARGWLWYFETLSQCVRLAHEFDQAVPGDLISDLWYRIQNDVPNPYGVRPSQVPPGVACLLIGTNSVNAGVPLPEMQQVYLLVLEWLVKQGHKVQAIAEWPRGSDAANSGLLTPDNQKRMYAFAEWIRGLRGRPNVWIVDVWPRTADPAYTDCRPLPNMLNEDDLHSAPGISFVTGDEQTRVAREEMALPRFKLCPASNGDQYDAVLNRRGCLNINPMLVQGTGGTLGANAAGLVPQNYALSASAGLTVTGSFVEVVIDGIKRKAYRMEVTGTPLAANSYASLRQTGMHTKLAAGDVIESGYEVYVNDDHVNFGSPGIVLDPGTTALRCHGGLSLTGDRQMPAEVVKAFYGVPRAADYPVGNSLPASLAIDLRPYFTASGVASSLTIDLLSVFVRKR
ncbi:SGNH/GDSL hydrolase family protein [Azotobacter vinelandii]|uniref:SGNH/GDSL hydrolase family protein n=1 Tax=Azotobacter vinelandii TaxID=354 RepID=UPI002666056F|nr:SGNH/GDSL hydrolase family protein [Azotobacter vinelandii]WKN20815.1 SGNH/GDSL hydrolase family protein [Azotobacter vinelandii]